LEFRRISTGYILIDCFLVVLYLYRDYTQRAVLLINCLIGVNLKTLPSRDGTQIISTFQNTLFGALFIGDSSMLFMETKTTSMKHIWQKFDPHIQQTL